MTRLLDNVCAQINIITRYLRGVMLSINPELMLLDIKRAPCKTLKAAVDAAALLGKAHWTKQKDNETISGAKCVLHSPPGVLTIEL